MQKGRGSRHSHPVQPKIFLLSRNRGRPNSREHLERRVPEKDKNSKNNSNVEDSPTRTRRPSPGQRYPKRFSHLEGHIKQAKMYNPVPLALAEYLETTMLDHNQAIVARSLLSKRLFLSCRAFAGAAPHKLHRKPRRHLSILFRLASSCIFRQHPSRVLPPGLFRHRRRRRRRRRAFARPRKITGPHSARGVDCVASTMSERAAVCRNILAG